MAWFKKERKPRISQRTKLEIPKDACERCESCGHVDIREDHTFVGLPKGMPSPIMLELKKTRVAGQMLRISPVNHVPPKPLRKPPKRQSGRPRRE